MARLLADENFPFPVVEGLRSLGHDAVTMTELDQADRSLPDEAVLALAAAHDRVLLTLNRRDFFRLHELGRRHAGVVSCTFDADFAGQAARIHAALIDAPDLRQKLVRVNRARD